MVGYIVTCHLPISNKMHFYAGELKNCTAKSAYLYNRWLLKRNFTLYAATFIWEVENNLIFCWNN